MEKIGDYPDVVIACVGGGSNAGGMMMPFVQDKISGKKKNLRLVCVEPTGSPSAYNPSNEVITVLAYNIKNATSTSLFEYYDDTYTGTSSPLTQPVTTTQISLVKISLLMDIDPNRAPVPRLYTSQVSLRNLKDNL